MDKNWKEIWKTHSVWALLAGLAVLCVLLCAVRLRAFLDWAWVQRLKDNLDFIGDFLYRYPWLATALVILILLALLAGRFSLDSTTVTVLGMEFQLRQTENAVKSQIKNFLSSKRSIFVFYDQYDNLYDCINSMYQILVFLRKQLVNFESFDQTHNESYSQIEGMIQEIGRFLTKYQSDYRRYYEMEIEQHSGFFTPFQEIQAGYGKRKEMLADFHALNENMKPYAEFFHIDIQKWEGWDGANMESGENVSAEGGENVPAENENQPESGTHVPAESGTAGEGTE